MQLSRGRSRARLPLLHFGLRTSRLPAFAAARKVPLLRRPPMLHNANADSHRDSTAGSAANIASRPGTSAIPWIFASSCCHRPNRVVIEMPAGALARGRNRCARGKTLCQELPLRHVSKGCCQLGARPQSPGEDRQCRDPFAQGRGRFPADSGCFAHHARRILRACGLAALICPFRARRSNPAAKRRRMSCHHHPRSRPWRHGSRHAWRKRVGGKGPGAIGCPRASRKSLNNRSLPRETDTGQRRFHSVARSRCDRSHSPWRSVRFAPRGFE